MASLALAFDILARDRASKTFKDVGDSAEKAGKKGEGFGSKIGKGMGIASLGLAGLAAGAAAGLGAFAKDAAESARIGRLTEAVVKSTGGAAKITAAQVGDLATAISNKTGADDEAIQSGANLLLTFTNVRNEAGKGNDIFNQATQTITDMSAALGQDTKASAVQLGKALNDPVKGVTALSKVGVSFTKQQKDQISTLVKSGDTLGAQKVILKELGKEFGGAAAAASDPMDRLGVIFGNLGEQVGGVLLPYIGKFADFLSGTVIPAVSGFVDWLGPKLGTAIDAVKGFLQPAIDTVKLFIGALTGEGADVEVPWMNTVIDAAAGVQSTFTTIGNALRGVIPVVVQFVTGTLVPLFQQAVVFIQGQVIPRIMGIVEAIRGFLSVAIPIVQQFVAGMMARIQPLMPQIRSIFATIGQIITGALDLIKAIIERVTAVISFVWRNWGQGIMNVIGVVWSSVIGVIGPALNVIKSIIKTVTSAIRGDWSGAWDGIKGILSGAVALIKGIISGSFNIIKATIGNAMVAIGRAIFNGVNNAAKWFADLPGRILSAIGSLGSQLFTYGVNAVQGFINGLISKAGEIVAVVRDKIVGVLPDFVKDFLGIHSPSRVMAELGKWTGMGLAVGIAGTQKQVVGRMERLVQALAGASKRSLANYARGVEAQLAAHARRRDAITTQLAAAQSKLKGLQADSAKYGADAKQRVLDTGTVVGMNSFGNIVAGLKRSVDTGKQFATVIGQLRASGLNKTSLDQIIQAGPAEGLAAGQQLLKGGKGGIGQVNALVSQLASSANSVGSQASSAMYGAGIQAAQGLVNGLKSQQAAITATMTSIARTMVAHIKAALKIKSPSRVFMEVGDFTARGMAIGIEQGAGRVHNAAKKLVPSLPPPGVAGGRGVASSAAGVGPGVKLHPHSVADLADAMSRTRPVASLDRRTVQRDLVAGMP